MNSDDVFIFQSGYTSSDLHDDEKVHRKIAKDFKDNLIIFFPQTVHYSTDKEAKKTAELYNSHKKILFLTRDQMSYEMAKKYFENIKIMLYPDIVTTMIGTYKIQNQEKKDGILFCIRSDSEKLYSDTELKTAFSDLQVNNIKWIDTTLKKGEKCDLKVLQSYIEIFSKYKLVITDRFHGTIISLIAKTPVIVLRTTDHKVSEGAKWFTEIFPEYIYRADDLSEAVVAAKKMYTKMPKGDIIPYFKDEYYDKLVDVVQILQ